MRPHVTKRLDLEPAARMDCRATPRVSHDKAFGLEAVDAVGQCADCAEVAEACVSLRARHANVGIDLFQARHISRPDVSKPRSFWADDDHSCGMKNLEHVAAFSVQLGLQPQHG